VEALAAALPRATRPSSRDAPAAEDHP